MMDIVRCEKHQLPMGTSYCNLCAVEYEREEVERLRAALEEISEGKGAYSMDPLEHAGNCIDDMKELAREALKPHQE